MYNDLYGGCQGILKGSITVLLTSCRTGLESAVLELTIFVFIWKTDYSKPVKQEANGTVMLPPLVFPGGYAFNEVVWAIVDNLELGQIVKS